MRLMFAYLAFKALTGRYPDALRSAQQKTPWKLSPAFGLPCLSAKKRSFKDGWGVFAATVEEAQWYADEHRGGIYLVAPLPGKRAVVGERGWRAEGALCLGPLTQENQPEVARLILAAAANGLPQVPAVLGWAIAVASQAEGALTRLANEEMLAHGIAASAEAFISLQPCLDEAPHRAQIARRLIALREAGSTVNAAALRWAIAVASQAEGKMVRPAGMSFEKMVSLGVEGQEIDVAWLQQMLPYFNNKEFSRLCRSLLNQDWMALVELRRAWLERCLVSDEVVEGKLNHRRAWGILALAKAHGVSGCPQELLRAAFDFVVGEGDLGWVYQLGLYCDDERWAEVVRKTLLESRRADLLCLAGRDWPDTCYSEAIRDAILASGDAHALYLAGKEWPDERYPEAIAEVLVRSGNAEYLYRAGRDWPTSHYHEAIAKALVKSGHAECLYFAGQDWPASRYREGIAKALVRSGDAEYLYYAGCDWPNERYCEAIAKALVKSGNAEYLYLAGMDWPDGRFSEAIAEALLETGDTEYLYLAGCDWSDERYREAIAEALVGSGDAYHLYLAGKEWPDERYCEGIAKALAKTGNAEYLYLAGRDWPDGRYREAIAEALVKSGGAEWLYYAGKDWPDERYREAIAEAFLATGNGCFFYLAGKDWPEGRYRKAIAEALVGKGNACDLYLAGCYWSEARYCDAIWRALLATGDERWINEAGKTWSPNRLTHDKVQAVHV